MAVGLRDPLIGFQPVMAFRHSADLVTAMGMARLGDNTGIMSTCGQHKGCFGVCQEMDFIN